MRPIKKIPAELIADGDHRAVNITDKPISEHDFRDLPNTPFAHMQQSGAAAQTVLHQEYG
jgi:hypothetical protein